MSVAVTPKQKRLETFQGAPGYRTSASRKVLVVDDDADIRELLKRCLEVEGFQVVAAESLEEMTQSLNQSSFDAVLLDIFLKHQNGLEALPELIRSHPTTKVIMMTGNGSVDLAVQAMKYGASNFLVKSTNPKAIATELKATVYSQFGIAALSDEPLPEDLGIIGSSPAIRKVTAAIDKMKSVDSTVLISGESGTGKELVARALHKLSPRSNEQFCAINCGAIPANLLESELFGHTKSAFTDAKSDRKGFFEVCSEGTLLLDEIGEMPHALQVKLLRVLQEREVTPLGTSKAIPVNTRVIASTNRSLDAEVKKGSFREDLYYRLSVLRIEIPPLRDRREDIPVLTAHFIDRFNQRFGKEVEIPSHEIMARLVNYDWHGNIRELQNAIERGVVLSVDNVFSLQDALPKKAYSREEPFEALEDSQTALAPLLKFDKAKEQFEKNYLTRLLKSAKGNISEASRISGEYRTKLYRLFQRYRINPSQFKD